MTFYDRSREEIIKELSTDEHSGLRSSEILVRWEKHGPNKLRGKKKKQMLQKLKYLQK